MISVESYSSAPDGSKYKIIFAYDSQWRRTSKIVSNWVSGAWALLKNVRFAYDGWNLIAELNATNNSVINSYLWGLDLSSTRQGAGAVGGLLAIKSTGNGTHFTAFDGNGNITALASMTNASITAQYEYDPFLNLIRETGPMAKLNDFTGSTKRGDRETGAYYYGYRYLLNGGWSSRDPLEEDGGPGLHAFVRNSPVDRIDALGLEAGQPEYRYQPVLPPGMPYYPLTPQLPPAPPANKPNTGGIGNVHYSRNSTTLEFWKCCGCNAILERIYQSLKSFSDWGENSVADFTLSGDIAKFDPKGAAGSLAGIVGNDATFNVRLSSNNSTHCVSARTLDNHALVGERKWCARKSESGNSCFITISTEAFERSRNSGNWLGGNVGPGYSAQRRIWEEYLSNIIEANRDGYCFKGARHHEPASRNTGSERNPWLD